MPIYCIAKCLHARTKLKARDKLVLLALCERADDDGGNAWPSVATLARYAECSTRTVQRVLAALERDGWIRVTQESTGQRPRVYAVELERLGGGVTLSSPGATSVARRGDRAMSPNTSRTVQRTTLTAESLNGREVADFVAFWCDTYKAKRKGTKYLVRRGRDIALIKRLLDAYGADRLKLLAELFLVTDDPFIASTDRGIPLLSAKSMWLDHKLREHGR